MLHRRGFLKVSLFGGVATGATSKEARASDFDSKPDPHVTLVEDIDLEPKQPPIYSTGVADLDDLIGGGLHRGLYLVMGGAGVGKTALLHKMSAANPGECHWVVPFVPLIPLIPFGLNGSAFTIESKQLAQDAFGWNRKLVFIDYIFPNEVWPQRKDNGLYAESLCRMSMKHDLTIVVAVRGSDPYNMFHDLWCANGGWWLDGDNLSVVKERYGEGRYAPNQGIVPWGPGSTQIASWFSHGQRNSNVQVH